MKLEIQHCKILMSIEMELPFETSEALKELIENGYVTEDHKLTERGLKMYEKFMSYENFYFFGGIVDD